MNSPKRSHKKSPTISVTEQTKSSVTVGKTSEDKTQKDTTGTAAGNTPTVRKTPEITITEELKTRNKNSTLNLKNNTDKLYSDQPANKNFAALRESCSGKNSRQDTPNKASGVKSKRENAGSPQFDVNIQGEQSEDEIDYNVEIKELIMSKSDSD